MKRLMLLTILGLVVFSVGIVGAIECSDAELSGDGIVNSIDLLKVSQCFNRSSNELSSQGESCVDVDMNGDEFIDDFEKGLVRYFYRQGCESTEKSIGCSDAEVTGDGIVNGFDLLIVRQCFNQSSSELSSQGESCVDVDMNGDGFIDGFEKGLVRYFYRQGCVVQACTDSDGGADYNTKGTTVGLNTYNETVSTTDYCVYYGQQGTYGMYLNPGETAVMEYVCNSDGETVNDELHVCDSYGCDDGKCLERDDVEDVVCEIDFYYGMENDVNCIVEYRGVTKECIIEANDEPGNQCVLSDMYISKPVPNEGYMPVPGLSGSFNGIQCGEIETAYNTNRFFVNCKFSNSDEEDEIEDEDDMSSCDSEGICVLYAGGEVGSEPALSGNEISIDSFYDSGVALLLSRQEVTNVLGEGDKYFNSEFEIIILEIDGDDKVKLDFNMLIDVENTPDTPVGDDTNCDNGCSLDEKCFNFGYRRAIEGDLKYCFESGEWLEQKGSEETCENSFECDSNLCVDDECISAGFFKRMMNWFARLFS